MASSLPRSLLRQRIVERAFCTELIVVGCLSFMGEVALSAKATRFKNVTEKEVVYGVCITFDVSCQSKMLCLLPIIDYNQFV